MLCYFERLDACVAFVREVSGHTIRFFVVPTRGGWFCLVPFAAVLDPDSMARDRLSAAWFRPDEGGQALVDATAIAA